MNRRIFVKKNSYQDYPFVGEVPDPIDVVHDTMCIPPNSAGVVCEVNDKGVVLAVEQGAILKAEKGLWKPTYAEKEALFSSKT